MNECMKMMFADTIIVLLLLLRTIHTLTVDWAAHLGGLVAGFVVGIPVFSCWIKTILWRVIWFVVGMALTAGTFAWGLTYMYSGVVDPAEELRDVCGYYQQFFEDYECMCMRDGGE